MHINIGIIIFRKKEKERGRMKNAKERKERLTVRSDYSIN